MMPDGKPMGDDEGNYLSIAAVKGDRRKLAAITEVAHDTLKNNGLIPAGTPFFMPGRRKINDEQYEEQKARLASGLVPDEYDIAAMTETLKHEREYNG